MTINFLTAKEVSELMKCSVPKAYVIIREFNVQMEKEGFKTNIGRVNEEQFAKAYGFGVEINMKQKQEQE
ncbi:MAG: DNA-binding protein [Vagococcus sp.]